MWLRLRLVACLTVPYLRFLFIDGWCYNETSAPRAWSEWMCHFCASLLVSHVSSSFRSFPLCVSNLTDASVRVRDERRRVRCMCGCLWLKLSLSLPFNYTATQRPQIRCWLFFILCSLIVQWSVPKMDFLRRLPQGLCVSVILIRGVLQWRVGANKVQISVAGWVEMTFTCSLSMSPVVQVRRQMKIYVWSDAAWWYQFGLFSVHYFRNQTRPQTNFKFTYILLDVCRQQWTRLLHVGKWALEIGGQFFLLRFYGSICAACFAVVSFLIFSWRQGDECKLFRIRQMTLLFCEQYRIWL